MLQNGYVLVLACGMLLCILTGGNIDLSVGSVICFVGGVAAVLIGSKGFNPFITILLCLVIGLLAVSYTHLSSPDTIPIIVRRIICVLELPPRWTGSFWKLMEARKSRN